MFRCARTAGASGWDALVEAVPAVTDEVAAIVYTSGESAEQINALVFSK
jgi:hypothetical protein